jgi:hypothetical protein
MNLIEDYNILEGPAGLFPWWHSLLSIADFLSSGTAVKGFGMS